MCKCCFSHDNAKIKTLLNPNLMCNITSEINCVNWGENVCKLIMGLVLVLNYVFYAYHVRIRSRMSENL